jgi:hypothetical protein
MKNCNPAIYMLGTHVATIGNLKPRAVESLVRQVAKKTKQRIDWHYVGGYAIIKCLGDSAAVRKELAKRKNASHLFHNMRIVQ